MSASFQYEDPLMRQQAQAGMNTTQKAREIFKDMGKNMWRSGKGFGKVGALFAGIECVIESVCLAIVSKITSVPDFHALLIFRDLPFSLTLHTVSRTK